MGIDYAKQVLRAAASMQEAARSEGLVLHAKVHTTVDTLVAKPLIDMDKDDIEFMQELLSTWKRRLRILKKKEAAFGLDCPAEILIEITDIEKTIEELNNKMQSVNNHQ